MPMKTKNLIAAILIATIAALGHQSGSAAAWSPPSTFTHNCRVPTQIASSSISVDSLNLTPELLMMVNAFSSIPDEKTRHKQLLYMASKLPEVDDSVRVPENKVPGCLSTVHVDCTVEKNDDGQDVINYFGDSDGLLTKGLLALLIRGLSGCAPEEINAVDPQFIKAAKISQTLTPGRNNGFLNMLAVMKKKAIEATQKEQGGGTATLSDKQPVESMEESTSAVVTSFDPIEGKPMYNAIMSTMITVLKPTFITLVDNSSQHAGHAGSKGWEESGESHFALEVVAEAFEGLSLVKRHQLIYMLLGETMQKIHALEIKAKSPSEV